VTDHRHGIFSVANLDDWIESNFAGELDPSFDGIDRAAWNSRCAQQAEPLLGRSGAQPLNKQRAQGLAVARAIFGIGEPGIMR
jgi:hypothetical protein